VDIAVVAAVSLARAAKALPSRELVATVAKSASAAALFQRQIHIVYFHVDFVAWPPQLDQFLTIHAGKIQRSHEAASVTAAALALAGTP